MSRRKINGIVDLAKMSLIVLISFSLVAVIVFSVSDDPFDALQSFFVGPFQSPFLIGNIFTAACPLIFTALAVVFIFAAGQFSMIAEGSFFIGSMGAMIVGIVMPNTPVIQPLLAMLLAGILGCAAAAVPAVLKAKWKVSELVTSIMFNYIVQFLVLYILSFFFRDDKQTDLVSKTISQATSLPILIPRTQLHAGVLIAIILCFLSYYALHKTKMGYEIRACGKNELFANYIGFNSTAVMLFAQLIGGFIAGMGGGVELMGMYTRFKWTVLPGYGWTGIVVALLARENPLLIPVSALFFGYLSVGSNVMAQNSDVSSQVNLVIQGVIMLFIAADAFLQHWKQHLVAKYAEEATSAAPTAESLKEGKSR